MDNNLYSVKDMLCRELASYANVTELNRKYLNDIDKLAHAAKNVCKIIEACEQEEPQEYSRAYRQPHVRMSYRRGRNQNTGEYMSRETNNSYHSQPELIDELKHLMAEAPNESVPEFNRLIQKLEETY